MKKVRGGAATGISGEKAILVKLLIWKLPDRVRKHMPITAWGEWQFAHSSTKNSRG